LTWVWERGISCAMGPVSAASSILTFEMIWDGIADRGGWSPTNWDPAVTDGLAETREVILFNNAGVASSSEECLLASLDAIAFAGGLGLSEVDLLCFAIGGHVVQEIVLPAPTLVRKMILVSPGLRGADMCASKMAEIFAASYDPPEHLWLAIHFTRSEASRAAESAGSAARIAIPRSAMPPPPHLLCSA
jgi:pimeloyl-ACP methyl ester carboxylesterase